MRSYILFFNGIRVYLASEDGRSGQDRCDARSIRGVETYSNALKYLSASFRAADSRIEFQTSGSCAIAAMITPSGHLVVGNLGDSQATLYFKHGSKVESFVINRLHNPDNEENAQETQKPITNKGYCTRSRIPRIFVGSRGLAISRAFGDHVFDNHPLFNRKAQYYVIDLNKIPQWVEVFLEVSCDGLFERSGVESHAEYFKKTRSGLENMATELCREARGRGSTDDLTCFVMPINITSIKKMKSSIFLGVYDGHGRSGDEVATLVKNAMAKNHLLAAEQTRRPGFATACKIIDSKVSAVTPSILDLVINAPFGSLFFDLIKLRAMEKECSSVPKYTLHPPHLKPLHVNLDPTIHLTSIPEPTRAIVALGDDVMISTEFAPQNLYNASISM